MPAVLPRAPITELLSPFDAGVSFPEYQETWHGLGPFEKCLVYWAEVHAFGVRLERESGTPWLGVHYEELLGASRHALAGLVAFLACQGRASREVAVWDRG